MTIFDMEIGVEGLAIVAVLDAAKDWWESNRPVEWSDEQHLAQPCVNTDGDDAGKRLAAAIGQMIALDRMNSGAGRATMTDETKAASEPPLRL